MIDILSFLINNYILGLLILFVILGVIVQVLSKLVFKTGEVAVKGTIGLIGGFFKVILLLVKTIGKVLQLSFLTLVLVLAWAFTKR